MCACRLLLSDCACMPSRQQHVICVRAFVHACVHIVVVCTRPPLIVDKESFESDKSVHIVCSAEGHYGEFEMGRGSKGSWKREESVRRCQRNTYRGAIACIRTCLNQQERERRDRVSIDDLRHTKEKSVQAQPHHPPYNRILWGCRNSLILATGQWLRDRKEG